MLAFLDYQVTVAIVSGADDAQLVGCGGVPVNRLEPEGECALGSEEQLLRFDLNRGVVPANHQGRALAAFRKGQSFFPHGKHRALRPDPVDRGALAPIIKGELQVRLDRGMYYGAGAQ